MLWGHGFWRTWKTSSNGEAAWDEVNSYGGGMQFTLPTWNNAARWSGGLVPHASSNAAIAQQPARVQILAAFFAVTDRGDWGDWPNTARACGLV